MFNALLGGFVAWSLTAGALPGPWPAAASLALGGALLLLHGHTHGAALTVDVLARRSRFLTVNPGLKLWCCAALLALCLLARTPWPPLALFFAASALTAAGGVRPRAYLSLLGAPATFLLLSGIALLWEYASAPGGVANVPFLGGYFVLRAPAQTAAGSLWRGRWARWAACISSACPPPCRNCWMRCGAPACRRSWAIWRY